MGAGSVQEGGACTHTALADNVVAAQHVLLLMMRRMLLPVCADPRAQPTPLPPTTVCRSGNCPNTLDPVIKAAMEQNKRIKCDLVYMYNAFACTGLELVTVGLTIISNAEPKNPRVSGSVYIFFEVDHYG